MARTKVVPTEGLLSDLEYTSVIVSCSNGIDSTGALYWAVKNKRVGRYTMPLYKQAGNSIPVPIFESLFRKMILHETAESEAGNGNI